MPRRFTLRGAALAAALASAALPSLASGAIQPSGVPADAESFASVRTEKTLLIPVRFAGDPTPGPLATQAELTVGMRSASWSFRNYFHQSSGGNLDYVGDVAPWTTIPTSLKNGPASDGSESLAKKGCTGFNWQSLDPAIKTAVAEQHPEINIASYKHFVYQTPTPWITKDDGTSAFGGCYGGLGYSEGPWVWHHKAFDSSSVGLLTHEWMHYIGVDHGRTLNCTANGAPAPLSDNCKWVGVPDHTDAQNSVSGEDSGLVMNGLHRLLTGFLPTNNVVSANTAQAGTYTIRNIYSQVAVGTPQLLRIPRGNISGDTDSTELSNYFVEYQKPTNAFYPAGSTDSLARGVTIRRGPAFTVGQKSTTTGAGVPRTVVATPGRGQGRFAMNARSRFTPVNGAPFHRVDPDVTLKVGQSIWDPVANYTITLQSLTNDAATIDVRPGGPTVTGAIAGVYGNTLLATANSSVASNIVISKQGDDFYVSDYGNKIRVGAGCSLVNVQTAKCPNSSTTPITKMEVRGGTKDDTIAITDSVGVIPAKIWSLGGNDAIEGGRGDDIIDGGLGDDAIDGGDGTDTASYAGRTTPVFAKPAAKSAFHFDGDGEVLVDPADIQTRGRGEIGENDGITKETENNDVTAANTPALPTVSIANFDGPGYWINEPQGTFSFSATNPSGRPVEYQCTFNGSATKWKPCNPGTYTEDLSGEIDSRYVFDIGVRAVDSRSQETLAQVFRQARFQYDGIDPDTEMTEVPSTNIIEPTGAKFRFTSPDLPSDETCHDWRGETGSCVSFEASIDGGAWNAVTSPWTAGTLSAGTHTIKIRARDLAGNVDETPYEDDFYVVPRTTITGGPADGAWAKAADLPVKYSFTSPDSGVTAFKCSINGSAFTACTSPFTVPTPSADGVVRFGVRAVAGILHGTPQYRNIGIDRVAPALPTITSGPAQGSTVTTDSATFAFSAELATTGTAPVRAEYLLDSGVWSTSSTNDLRAYGLSDGQHTFSVRAVDESGNVSGVVSRTFTVDAPAAAGSIRMGTPTAPATSVNLTGSPANLDWVHWKGATNTNADRANVSTARIQPWTRTGTTGIGTITSPITTFSWTNNKVSPTSGSSNIGVTTSPTISGNGFRFDVTSLPDQSLAVRAHVSLASTTAGTLSSAYLKATLDSGASVSSSSVSTSSTTLVDRVITVKFRRASSTDKIRFEWVRGSGAPKLGLYAASLR